MWTIIIIGILSALVLMNLVRVMIYGKGVLRPNFRRADEKFTAKTGFKSSWNTRFGKAVYYLLLLGIIFFAVLLIKTLTA